MPTAISALMPESSEKLASVQAAAVAAVDSGLLELMAGSAAHLIGFPGLPAGAPGNDRDCDVLAFVEQFVIDVSGVTDGQREALRRHIPQDDLRAFVSAFYVTEFSQRLSLMSDRLDLSLTSTAVPSPPDTDVVQALRDYQDAVMRESVLDPITTELVRLRCARVHNCRICKTLRLDRAHSVGVDESMTSKVDFYEQSDLSPRIKRALRITDAFITLPASMSEETAADARENLSPEQRANLLLSITKWSTQKVHVSLGTDGADALPRNGDGLSFFDFEENGRVAGYAAVPTDA